MKRTRLKFRWLKDWQEESPDSTMLTFNASKRYWRPVHRSVLVHTTACCLWAMKTTPR